MFPNSRRPKAIDWTNATVGRLRVLRRLGTNDAGAAIWECECACGKRVERKSQVLSRGVKDSRYSACRSCINRHTQSKLRKP